MKPRKRLNLTLTDGNFKAEFIDVASIIAQRLLALAPYYHYT